MINIIFSNNQFFGTQPGPEVGVGGQRNLKTGFWHFSFTPINHPAEIDFYWKLFGSSAGSLPSRTFLLLQVKCRSTQQGGILPGCNTLLKMGEIMISISISI